MLNNLFFLYQTLNLLDVSIDILKKYKPQIIEKSKLKEHQNIINFMSDKNTNKSLIVKKLAKDMNIPFLDINSIKLDDIIFNVINDKKWLLMQKMFRINRKVPTTKDEMFKLYISLLKHITTNDIIKTTQNSTLTNKKRGYTYKLNKELLLYHIELNKYSNEDLINYDIEIINLLDIEKPQINNKMNVDFDRNFDND